MHRLLFAFLALILFLSACTSQTASKTEITLWAFSFTKDAIGIIKDQFEKQNQDIKVKVETINYGDLRTRLLAAIQSGVNVPDVVVASSAWAGSLIAAGGLEPLDKYYDSANLRRFLPQALDIYRYRGQQYGIPLDLDLMMLFYRADIVDPILKKWGWKTFPDSWDNFSKLAKAVTVDKDGDGRPEQYALPLGANDPYTLYTGFVTPAGGRYFRGNKSAVNSPEFERALQFYTDLIRRHKVALEWTASFGDIVSGLRSGLIVMYPIGPWYKSEMKINLPEMAGKWRLAPMPVPHPGNPSTAITGISLAIPVNALHKNEAARFIKFLTGNDEALLTYFKYVGSPVPVTSLWGRPIFKETDPYFKQRIYEPILTALKNGKPIELIPQQKILEAIGAAQEKAVRGKATVKNALAEAAREINNLLK